MFDAY